MCFTVTEWCLYSRSAFLRSNHTTKYLVLSQQYITNTLLQSTVHLRLINTQQHTLEHNTQAKETLEAWYRDRPEVREWQENTREMAKRDGYVRTIMGRRRNLKEVFFVCVVCHECVCNECECYQQYTGSVSYVKSPETTQQKLLSLHTQSLHQYCNNQSLLFWHDMIPYDTTRHNLTWHTRRTAMALLVVTHWEQQLIPQFKAVQRMWWWWRWFIWELVRSWSGLDGNCCCRFMMR